MDDKMTIMIVDDEKIVREAGFYMEQFKEHVAEDVFKKCENNADSIT